MSKYNSTNDDHSIVLNVTADHSTSLTKSGNFRAYGTVEDFQTGEFILNLISLSDARQ